MQITLQKPTPELVTAACARFDHENQILESALRDLFEQYPLNDNAPHILLKVAALNALYHTQIFAVFDVALHIHRIERIDESLQSGLPELVQKIARITLSVRERNNFSFATKYCHWHRPEEYPIWDSYVDRYLWILQKQDPFDPAFTHNRDLWDYPKFKQIVSAFRDHYGLKAFSFKQIDKYLWSEGEKLAQQSVPTGVGGSVPGKTADTIGIPSLESKIQEGLDADQGDLYSEDEARAHLASLRSRF